VRKDWRRHSVRAKAIQTNSETTTDFLTNSVKDLNCLHSVTGLKRKTVKAKDFPNLTEIKKPTAKDLDLRKNLEKAKGFRKLRGLKMVKPKSLDSDLHLDLMTGSRMLRGRAKGFQRYLDSSSVIRKMRDLKKRRVISSVIRLCLVRERVKRKRREIGKDWRKQMGKDWHWERGRERLTSLGLNLRKEKVKGLPMKTEIMKLTEINSVTVN
jgi:hypothetical protein